MVVSAKGGANRRQALGELGNRVSKATELQKEK